MQRYRTYSQYLVEKYGEKVYKLPVNLPITCPNRDGTVGEGGCIFCGEVGAAFENLPCTMDVREQILENMNFIGKKYKAAYSTERVSGSSREASRHSTGLIT